MMKTILKNINKIIVMTLTACLLMGSIVHAEETDKLYIEEYTAQDNRLNIYLNTTSEEELTKDAFEVIIGDNTYPVEEVKPFASSGENVSYLFLVDVSGSVTETDITNSKEILSHLVEMMEEGDNAAVLEVRDEIAGGEFVDTKEDLLERIHSLERTKEDTNLYLGIRNALDMLASDSSCHPRKCLVVISDGKDDQKNGILFEDVRDAVKSADIPVCTLAMPLRASEQSPELAPDKIMKSFAENAAGGIYINYDNNNDNEVIAQEFDAFARSGYIVSVSLTDFASNASDMTLSVKAAVGQVQMEDSCQIPSYVMASVAKTTQPEEVAEEEEVATGEIPEGPKTEEENPKQGNEKLFYVMIILAVLALGGALAFLGVSKKKKEEKDPPEKVQGEVPQKKEISQDKALDHVGEDSNTPTQAAKEEELLPIQKETEEPKKRQITFSLIKMGLGQTDVYTAVCENEILIGRSKNADICIGDDKQLSGRHCKVRKEGNKYYIKDLDSTNGTVLNGVPIEEETPLMQDDVIFIGAFEYRITWE